MLAIEDTEDVWVPEGEEEPSPIKRDPPKLEFFLDMDGVVADFVGPALKAHSYDHRNFSWPTGVFDFEEALDITTEKFWHPIDHLGDYFWSTLPCYPWAEALVSVLEKHGKWRFLSSPSRHHSSAAGKVQWISQHFDGAKWIFAEASDKQLLAGHRRVLIDDRDSNVQQWREAGGHAILFPQPWNSAHSMAVSGRIDFIGQEISGLLEAIS